MASRVGRIKRAGKFLWQRFTGRPPFISYVAGYNGHRNLGDEAIYAALQNLFRPAHFVDYPKGLELKSSLSFLSQVQMALLAGGTIIGPKTSTVERVKRCFGLSGHCVVFGTGVCHPQFWAERVGADYLRFCFQQWKKVLEKCDYIGVRGPMSAEALNDVGLHNVEVIGDPVLVFAQKDTCGDEALSTPTLGLNICQTKGNMWGSEDLVCEEFVKLAAIAKRADWQVKWFVLWPPDLTLTRKVAVASRTAEHIYKIYEHYHEYLDTVKTVSVFVGMRLHSVALATCAYVPSIMLEYRPKCRDYMMSIGQEDVTIRTDHFEGENVWEMIQTLSSQRQRISELLYHAIKPLRQKQFRRAEELMGKISTK
jgi:polysaccharide pyruvyl transferase WcaK-like protein